MRINEKHLCEAVIGLLEEALGQSRSDVTFPEDDRSGPPVEVRVRLGERRYAIEHTLLEPFPKAIETGKHFCELTDEITAELHGTMPKPGVYTLIFPRDPIAGRPRSAHPPLRSAILEWVRRAAAELHAEAPERLDRNSAPHGYSGEKRADIGDLPLLLERKVHWSESGRHDGALFVSRIVGPDLEEQRTDRLRTSLQKKFPKLAACAEEEDVTILILENSDFVLSNQVLIAQALEEALSDQSFRPDYVFIADTTLDEVWHLFQPVVDGVFSIDMKYIEIDPPSRGRRD